MVCKDSPDGAVVAIRVTPRGRKDAIGEVRDGRLRVRTTAPPVEGAANERVIELIAKAAGVRRSTVSIVSGAQSRDKRLLVEGLSADELRRRLGIRVASRQGG